MTIVWFVILFAVWALVHSLTAARPFKRWVRDRVGQRAFDGFYRLFYNLAALVTFLPILYVVAARVPHTLLWRAGRPLSFLFLFVQLLGLIGLLISLWQTDPFHFAGLRQAYRYLRGEPDVDPPRPFIKRGAYAYIRHPLYSFSLVVIWFTPIMTLSTFVFNSIATLYFLLGAMHEERRLLREFGDTYRRYRQRVPAFIPFL